jgi:mono/diheme cytochrome c family protein
MVRVLDPETSGGISTLRIVGGKVMRASIGTAAVVAVLLSLGGCGDNDTVSPGNAQVARGTYLVEHVAACGDCHTPRTVQGQLDMSHWLAGALFTDLDPQDPNVGAVYAPNLTPDSTGLRDWTNDQIKNAFLNGLDEAGDPLFPAMPYWVFHNMTAGDADAIVAYLRSITPVNNPIPARQPLGFPLDQPAQPIPEVAIPHSTLAAGDAHAANAERGRYLAAMVGVCIDCHTPMAPGNPVPVRLDSLFAGGQAFDAAELGVPVPPFPATIYSANITPDTTGIADDAPEDVRTELRQGVDKEGNRICPPMPVGPDGAFGGLTSQDALDIGWYVTTLPPIRHVVPDCTPPAP